MIRSRRSCSLGRFRMISTTAVVFSSPVASFLEYFRSTTLAEGVGVFTAVSSSGTSSVTPLIWLSA